VSGVSLVFPAYNRLEFTKQAWAALMANTDWSLVEEFHVYDDGSTDGTCDFLAEEFDRRWCQPVRIAPCERMDMAQIINAEWHCSAFRSPMGVTLDWIRRSKAPLLAKLDNDTIYPPGWLNIALDVMERHPELDMLGLECMRRPAKFRDGRWWPPALPVDLSEKYVCDQRAG
jgi:glycosyltransferase involved in cell wall biosynthesis